MSKEVVIDTQKGKVCAELSTIQGQFVQVNVYLPPEGAGFFLVYQKKKRAKAMEAAKRLIEGEPLADDADISKLVPGAVVAGSVKRPTFKVRMGTPEVRHAAA